MRKLVARDYVLAVRQLLTRSVLRQLILSATRIWPRFNREPMDGSGESSHLSDIASGLRLHFKASPNAGKDGLALRGFYADKSGELLRRPLIYVNTAHHPLAVAATFCHEVGHHLSTRILAKHEGDVLLYFDADYGAHLEDQAELAADALVSLAAYPLPAAKRLFRRPGESATHNLDAATLERIKQHYKRSYGFDFSARMPVAQNLHYLTGMVHYAKLRAALLEEFGA